MVMLEVLTRKLTSVFDRLGGKGKLGEEDVDEALRQVRLALLEADVNFKVVREFLAKVKGRALDAAVLHSLTPAQQVIKIVNEELVAILGKEHSGLVPANQPPFIALVVGLQGSGKTTTVVKLAVHLKRKGQHPLLVAADTRRPAAVEQLKLLAERQNIPVYFETKTQNKDGKVMPTTICLHALEKAKELASTWVIVDSQGRLHIDKDMMMELADIKSALQPSEVLLTVDAMTGQEAVKIAQEFHSQIGLTGLILTKMDGDARGGAALSIRFISGVPIKFMGTGEKVDDLEPFYPDRLASRILGMGDVLSFIERAEKTFDQQQAKNLEQKVRTTGFDLEDLLSQIRQIGKMGALGQLIELVPGLSRVAPHLPDDEGEKRLKKIEAIISSTTYEERHNPNIITGSRRRRIARGSGTTPQDVNQLLNQFYQLQKLTKSLARGKLPKNMANTFIADRPQSK
jgi:signal recognition particle subunit SRP54